MLSKKTRIGDVFMIIKKKNIRNSKQYLDIIVEKKIRICSPELTEALKTKLKLTKSLKNGDSLLPTPIGPKTRFNANGKFIPLKREPKEMRIVGEREWSWKDFGGNWHSKIIDIERLCYQREFILPPSHELIYHDNKLYSEEIDKNDTEKTTFIINLFLEIFKECEIVDAERNPIIKMESKNWEILPPGEYPFEKIINSVKGSRRGKDFVSATLKRLDFYKEHKPSKTMIGTLGFLGYVMFFFDNYIVLDSIHYGDAIYIFTPEKEDLCALPKKDILSNKYHADRIIHRAGWEASVLKYLR